jgi:hypothetical protein
MLIATEENLQGIDIAGHEYRRIMDGSKQKKEYFSKSIKASLYQKYQVTIVKDKSS